ncbi:FtsX-like permease family protein [Alloscardovia macacae]|uniref:ATP synthase F0, A subunit n=1 Tax=Alloscardovia macacae TaxID=1160091 RepID=A0A261F1T4_9BIFI|nr:ABC transporter permease [Alloscardovia macacae]OZG53074.1 ATP synthase F0, A subunit [Alloscardovia macacae]
MASPINKLFLANVKHHASRYVSTAVAVTIAATFVVLCLTLMGGISSAYMATIDDATRGTSTVIAEQAVNTATNADTDADATAEVSLTDAAAAQQAQTERAQKMAELRAQAASAVKSVPGVSDVVESTAQASVEGETYQYNAPMNVSIGSDGRSSLRALEYLQKAPLTQYQYKEGRAPQAANEIAVDDGVTGSLQVKVGDSVEVSTLGVSTDAKKFTITGIIGVSNFSNGSALATKEGVESVQTSGATNSLLVVPQNTATRSPQASVTSQEELTSKVNDALKSVNASAKAEGVEFKAYPAQRFVESGRQHAQTQVTAMTSMALIFPLIAAFVAAIIVGTTFQVIALQRRRELALLRAVGAQAKQVRALVLRETSIAGTVSALIGTAVGTLAGAWLLTYLNVAANYIAAFSMLPWTGIILTWVGASLITIFVGLAPSREAAKVSPLAALAPVQSVQETRRKHTVRVVLSIILLVASIAGIVYGLRLPAGNASEIYVRFGIVVLATFVCWIAAMMLFTVVLPYIIYFFGSVVRTPVGRLARENVVRNPSRTASTGVAVIIGVVLMSTIAIGVSSVRSTLDSSLNKSRPVDIYAGSYIGTLSKDELAKLHSFEYASKTVDIRGVQAVVNGDTQSPVTVLGYPDLTGVQRSELPVVADGTIHVTKGAIMAQKATVSVCFLDASGQQTTCREYKPVEDSSIRDGSVHLSAADLKAAVPDAGVAFVAMRIKDGTPYDQVFTGLQRVGRNISMNGGYVERSLYMQALNIIVLVFMALLGVSVVISLVGVSNTLGLSVAERTQENGLLRALGLTRGQMKRLLVMESFLTSLVSTLVGIGLGTIFAAIGMYTLPFNDLGVGIEVTLPYDQLAGLVLIIVLASTLAAWLPGRKAAKVSPVEALAHE